MIKPNLSAQFAQSSVPKTIYMKFPNVSVTDELGTHELIIINDKFDGENFKLHEVLCTEDSLTLGACEASEFEATIVYDKTVPSLVGARVELYIALYQCKNIFDIDYTKCVPLGIYIVEEDKHDAGRTKRTLHGFDLMYQILNWNASDWYHGTLYKTGKETYTIGQIRESFFSALSASIGINISQETITLVNDSIQVAKSLTSDSGLSGKDVVTGICEINGVLGHVDRTGIFRYITIAKPILGVYPSDEVYPTLDFYPQPTNISSIFSDVNPYKSCQYEDYSCRAIDKVQIRSEEGDVGGTYPTSGNYNNAYVITANFLAIGVTGASGTSAQTIMNTMARNLYNKIKGISYMPSKLEVYGNPCLEVGDIYRCITRDGQDVLSYILERNLSGVVGLSDTYECKGTEYVEHSVSSGINSELKRLQGKSNVLIRDLDKLESRIDEYGDDLSEANTKILQTSKQILLTASKATAVYDESKYSYKSGSVLYTKIKNRGAGDYTSIPDGASLVKAGGSDTDSSGYYYLNISNGKLYYTSTKPSDGVWAKHTGWGTPAQLATLAQNNYAQFSIQNDKIDAKVERSYRNTNKSFGWSLSADEFKLVSNSEDIFVCDKDKITMKSNGAEVARIGLLSGKPDKGTAVYGLKISGNATFTGKVNAQSGSIGSGSNKWIIKDSAIYYGAKTLFNAQKDGVYIGTDGIALGYDSELKAAPFSVSSSGELVAANATITGTINAISGVFKNCTIAGNCVVEGKISASNITEGILPMSVVEDGSIGGTKIGKDAIGTQHITSGTVYAKLVDQTANVSCGTIRVGANGEQGNIEFFDKGQNQYVHIYAGSDGIVKWIRAT